MSSKVLPPDGGPRLEAPLWRQAGAPVPASRQTQPAADESQKETAQLRARLAEFEAHMPAAVEQARQETRRNVEADAARAEASNAKRSLDLLPASEQRDALLELCVRSVERSS